MKNLKQKLTEAGIFDVMKYFEKNQTLQKLLQSKKLNGKKVVNEFMKKVDEMPQSRFDENEDKINNILELLPEEDMGDFMDMFKNDLLQSGLI